MKPSDLEQQTLSYMLSVMEKRGADGLLSPGDARRLLAQHNVPWEAYSGSRDPEAILGFLDYPIQLL